MRTVLNLDGTTSVKVPLKKEGQAVSCPEEDRCQLEVEDVRSNNSTSVTTIEEATDVILERKKLSVVMKTDEECIDFKIHVGMAQGTAPRACGHHWVEWENFYDPWEEYLASCERVPNRLENFPQRPLDLTQVRYMHEGRPISLMHYKFIIAEGDAANQKVMIAARVFKDGNNFVKTFSADNNAVVSAALSYDFNTLYIVVSSLPPPSYEREASWEKHVWDKTANKWSMVAISSMDMRDRSERPMTVSRDGTIGGAFETELTTYSELNQSEGSCIGVDGHVYDRRWNHQGSSFIGENENYSIEHLEYRSGKIYVGFSITGGDFAPIKVGSFASRGDNGNDFSFEFYNLGDGVYWEEVLEETFQYNTMNEYKNLTMGSLSFERLFNGIEYHSNVHWEMNNRGNLPTSPYWHEGYNRVEYYTEKDGYRNLTVLGGWIIVTEIFTDRILDSYETIYNGPGQVFQECPANGDLVLDFTSPTDPYPETNTYKSVHPIVLEPYVFSHTFLSHDQESGDTYCGALIMDDVDGDPYWRVWKNGGEITGIMHQCVNMDPNEFSGIYFP